MNNILDYLNEKEELKTFLAAVNDTRFKNILNGEGPFTVLAFQNSAFDNLPENMKEDLFYELERLADILAFHVVHGKLLTSEIKKMDELDTMEGGELTIKNKNEKIYLNNAKIVRGNIEVKNGVIHIIDKVLIPV